MGIIAIYIKENGVGKLYYTATDHLGSICQIIEPNGTVVEETNYDPWGRNRNTTNWTYTNAQPLNTTYRGYTGHEELPQFALINMNGRLYDPVLGRMLSPDNYVQSPYNPQNYNRYAYVLNNPLKYTDPSGEFWGIAVFGLTFLTQSAENVMNGVENPVKNAYNYANEVTTNIDNAFMFTIYSNDNLNISAGLSLLSVGPMINASYNVSEDLTINGSAGAGLLSGFYANLGAIYKVGDFTLSAGAGYSKGGVNIFSSESIPGGSRYYAGVNYYDRPNNQYFSIGYTTFGGQHAQGDLYIGWSKNGWHAGMSNDILTGDKFRTAAGEIGYDNMSVGFNLYTTEPPKEEYKKAHGLTEIEGHKAGMYTDGRRISAGMYFGYTSGNYTSRIGIDSPWVQKNTQNVMHWVFGRPYWDTSKGAPSNPYGYSGYAYPYSFYSY